MKSVFSSVSKILYALPSYAGCRVTFPQNTIRVSILLASRKAIILDMRGVDYVSSMGIGSIFKIRKFAKENKIEIATVNIQPQVKKVFDTVQAMPQEAIFESLNEIDAYLDRIQKDKKRG